MANIVPNPQPLYTIWDALALIKPTERTKLLLHAAEVSEYDERTVRRRLQEKPIHRIEEGIILGTANFLGISTEALKSAIENRLVFGYDAATGQLITYAPNQSVIA